MKLHFTKMQGTGNDFVVLDATRTPFAPDPALLQRLTDRRYGVGCDQVLVVQAPTAPGLDFDYRIFNADGSEVGQCGNGARCLARFVSDRGLSRARTLRVRTRTTLLEMELLDDGRVRVNMGMPRFEPRDIPFTAPARAERYSLALDRGMIELGVLSMGNPHAVLEVADVDRAPVEELGAALQKHPAFPDRVNVGFLQVVDRGRARLRVYERGVGETLSCGSGACAALVMGKLWGKLDARAELEVRGGRLTMEWQGEADGGHPVFLTGPAETVYQGEMEWPK